MKIISVLFILILLFIPIFAFADCSKSGITVVFINGVWENEISAKDDLKQLNREYNKRGQFNDVVFSSGYNESHGGGVIDIIESATQMYAGGYLDHDLTDILRKVHADLKTQKILLVGHSQGTFYTNAAYNYLVSHGVDKNSIAVYNVATPADRVAGNGKYLTSDTDEVINAIVRALANGADAGKPLPANINIEIPNNPGVDYENGHSFNQVYLGLAPDRIIGDMDKELSGLSVRNDKNECFVQPNLDAIYYVTDTGYYIADNVSENSRAFVTSPFSQSQMNSIFQGIYDFGKRIANDVMNVFNQGKVFGASLLSSFTQNSSQGPSTNDPIASVVVPQTNSVSNQIVDMPVETESVQDQLDDIQEKLDIINQQVQTIVAQQNPNVQLAEEEITQQSEDENKDNDKATIPETHTTNQKSTVSNGGNATFYPKILISEVQVNPIAQRFVELYNPNSVSVSLNGWYLQRKDNNDISWGSLVSSSYFENKFIPANGYFLISRELDNSDILSNITLSDDNSLALKNPNGDVSDKLGFGNAIDPEIRAAIGPGIGQSIGRKVLADGTEQDSYDNFADFELDMPSPSAQNFSKSNLLSISITTPATKLIYNIGDSLDVSGLTVSGVYSNGSVQNKPITSSNITGFDSTKPTDNEVLTITIDNQTTNYSIAVEENIEPGSPSITSYTISNPVISPDGDGVKDSTSIDLSFSEDVKVNIDIVDKNGVKVRDLYYSAKVKNPEAKIWDGKDNSGAVVADGIYTIRVIFADASQNSVTDTSKTITVNTTTPILNPSSDATVTSSLYAVSSLNNGIGSISGVVYDTPKLDFESVLTPATGAILNFSGISDLIATGDTLIVTAQDGITKSKYTITVDTTNWAQGIIDSFTSSGKFVLHTSDFIPNSIGSLSQCGFLRNNFKDVYPNTDNQSGSGSGGCSDAYPSYYMDMSTITDPGEYDIYISYCGGSSCFGNNPIGDYYRIYFDGSSWSPVLPIDSSKTRLSNDATLKATNYYVVNPLLATYAAGILTGGTGTITNVRLNTSKADFESALTPATGATLDFSNVNNPVATGDTIVATSQDKMVKIIYTITVDKISWSQGTIIGSTSDGKFSLDTSFFTDNESLQCYYQSYHALYPFLGNLNETGSGAFPCGGNNGTRPIYTLDMSYISIAGDYAIWMSDLSTNLGEYYQMHFDGSVWSAINPAPTIILSNDSSITSPTYTIGSGAISNVPLVISKADFESALVKNQANQTWNDSGVENPVMTGDTLVVTAQDGITKSTYVITVNRILATQLKIITSPQTISAGNASGIFTVESQDVSGSLAKVLTTTHVNLSSDSLTGLFAWAPAGGSCDDDWTKTRVTISKNTANRSFCYKDSAPGTYSITVSSDDLSSDSQTVIVNP